MNLLGLVFSLLLLLSYGYYACWDKHKASSQLRSAYCSHHQLTRKILNSYASEIYGNLEGKKKTGAEKGRKKERTQTSKNPKEKPAGFNRPCARLNLWPLVHQAKDADPILYELAAKLLRIFYEPLLEGEKKFEYDFLDLLLASIRKTSQEEGTVSLEKISLLKPEFQPIYYNMLKGTKSWDRKRKRGYPSLLDYFQLTPSQTKVCVFHSDPPLLEILFDPQLGEKLYQKIHSQGAPLLTKNLIEQIASETHHSHIDPDLFNQLQFGRPKHEEKKKAFTAQDSKNELLLRKNLYLENG